MKRIIPLLLLAATVCVRGQPADVAVIPAAPPSPQSVQALAVLAKVDKIRDAVLVQINRSMDAAIKQALGGQAPTPADNAVVDGCRSQITSALDEEMSGAKIRAMYAKVYTETFTQDEIDGLIAFYSTPVGKVFADKIPELNGKIGLMVQQSLGRVGMKLQVSVMTAMQKVRNAHAPKAVIKPAAVVPAKPPASAMAAPSAAPVTATPKGN